MTIGTSMTLDAETVRTLAWGVTIAFAIHSWMLYSVIRLFIIGRPLFERRKEPGTEAESSRPLTGTTLHVTRS